MDFEIIDCDRSHLPALCELEKRCFSDAWTEDALASQLPDRFHSFIAAKSGDGLLGYVCMTHIIDEAEISNVAVDPVYRRQGIGAALVAEMLSRADQMGMERIMLEVRESNVPAKVLYERHGFVPYGKRKNYYENPREDAVLMMKNMK